MHVPDGFLSPLLTLPAYAAAAPLWALTIWRHFGPKHGEKLPLMGALAAVAFILQTIAIPVPGGTTVHLLGVPLLAIVLGPSVAFVSESLVLLVQAVMLGQGGVTTLGVNALCMGLGGAWASALAYRVARRVHPGAAPFFAGWAGVFFSSLFAAVFLLAQHALDPGYFPSPPPAVFTAMLVPSSVTGLMEGAFTVAAQRALIRAKVLQVA